MYAKLAHFVVSGLVATLCTSLFRYPFSTDQAVPECDWEIFLRETASLIVEQQSPQRCSKCFFKRKPAYKILAMH